MGHGGPRWTTADHGGPWLTMADRGGPCRTPQAGIPATALPLQALACQAQPTVNLD